MLDPTMSTAVFRYHYDINKLICFIKKNEEKISRSVKANSSLSATNYCVRCHDLSHKQMERALCVWLEDET